ncbi:MAG: hypothetical protein KDA47_10225 [Planctomycetales bacterium]|nr:hypothetical protein [Planctomycetales bacterium]
MVCKRWLLASWIVMAVATGRTDHALGQQVTLGTPMQRLNDSFYESFGFNWGFRSNRPGGLFFHNGGVGQAVPPFGNFNPNSQAGFGFGGNGWHFGFSGGAGSSRSIISETPYVTVPNGGFGYVGNQSLRPFVTGVVPVVGDGSRTMLDERLRRLAEDGSQDSRDYRGETLPDEAAAGDDAPLSLGPQTPSSAEQSDLSVAEIRRQQQAAETAMSAEIDRLVARAKLAEAEGKRAVARIHLEQAARRASGEQRQRLLEKIAELRRAAE